MAKTKAKLSKEPGIPAIKSSSLWGNLTALVAGVGMLFTDPTVLAVIPAPVLPVVTIIGAAIGIYGRVTAENQITSVVKSKDEEPTE